MCGINDKFLTVFEVRHHNWNALEDSDVFLLSNEIHRRKLLGQNID